MARADDDRNVSATGPFARVRAFESQPRGEAARFGVALCASNCSRVAVDADATGRWFVNQDALQELCPSASEIDDRSVGERLKARGQRANAPRGHRRVELELPVSRVAEVSQGRIMSLLANDGSTA
jgi:hypothetical protein